MERSIVVVTPYVGEPDAVVERCIASVRAQRAPLPVRHVLVSDGCALPDLPDDVEGIALPRRTGDGGATPRAVGSVFAIGGLQATMAESMAIHPVATGWAIAKRMMW